MYVIGPWVGVGLLFIHYDEFFIRCADCPEVSVE